MAYIDTPRTDAGNATYLTNGHNIDNLSVEPSFLSPSKKKDDLVSQLRNNRGLPLETPRSRAPFANRRNIPTVPAPGEFTPLLKSAAKNNILRKGKENGFPHTPAFLKAGYKATDSPALPVAESSVVYGDDTGSSIGTRDEGTPVPRMVSSSEHSTPLAVLPKRNGEVVLADQGNILTLREQENIIDKIEKENFGLKLKIHFLEESLRKAGPELNQTAVKENTELKVDKITMQKELSRTRKTLIQAEHELEQYRHDLHEAYENAKRNHADQGTREKLGRLQQDIVANEGEIRDLRRQLSSAGDKDEQFENLRGAVEDLEAELREKDRQLEERDEELDKLKEHERQDANDLVELEAELNSANSKVNELRSVQDTFEDLKSTIQNVNAEVERARTEMREAQDGRKRAEKDLNELRDEMANKSFSTKGLGRQLEEKANKLQDDLGDLRKQHTDLQEHFEDKAREIAGLEEVIQNTKQDAEVREQKLRDDNELLQHEHQIAIRKRNTYQSQIEALTKDLQSRSEEKDLLLSRHDALATESQGLQKDVTKAQAKIQQLQQSLEEEKQHALENDRTLRNQARREMDQLTEKIDGLRRELADTQSRCTTNEDCWESQRRDLQSQKEKADQRADGLKRTVDKLQESEGTLSGREMKLQEALESEKTRHTDEEAVLSRQIHELKEDVDNKRRSVDELRSELSKVNEDLRVCGRDQAASEERIQALEDEIEILQSSLDDEEHARYDVAAVKQEADDLQRQLLVTKQELARTEVAYADARAEIETLQRDFKVDEVTRKQMQRVEDKKQTLEDELGRANTELDDFKASAQSTKDELASSQSKVQQLELHTRELKRLVDQAKPSHQGHDMSIIQHDLSAAQGKEIEYLRREASQKDVIRDLKQKIASLERQLHEAELSKLIVDSPKSSLGGSARKTEVIEIRQQLAEAHQQIKDVRARLKISEREAQGKITVLNKEYMAKLETYEQQRDELEQEISACRLQQEDQIARNTGAEKTICRLRKRIHSLEKQLHSDRLNRNDDRTMAEERKDLHELLKDAKLEAEDLQVQIADREERIQSASLREKDLRTQLRRVREERTLQAQKAGALSTELGNLQHRYEQSVDNLARQQQVWEAERKAIISRVRFPNMSVSSVHAVNSESTELEQLEKEIQEKERRHQGELRGLAKQIQWLRARCKREEGFRAGLAYEKKFLLLQIDMYNACNTADLHILEEMGVTPDRKTREKRPSLRAVGLLVLASVRMKRLQCEWAAQKKIQASLVKKAEQVRRISRKSGGR